MQQALRMLQIGLVGEGFFVMWNSTRVHSPCRLTFPSLYLLHSSSLPVGQSMPETSSSIRLKNLFLLNSSQPMGYICFIIFYFEFSVCVNMSLCGHGQVNTDVCGGQRRMEAPQELGLQMVVNYLTWMLGTELESSARAVHSESSLRSAKPYPGKQSLHFIQNMLVFFFI